MSSSLSFESSKDSSYSILASFPVEVFGSLVVSANKVDSEVLRVLDEKSKVSTRDDTDSITEGFSVVSKSFVVVLDEVVIGAEVEIESTSLSSMPSAFLSAIFSFVYAFEPGLKLLRSQNSDYSMP